MPLKIIGVILVLYGGFGTFISIVKLGLINFSTEGLPEISILQILGIVEDLQQQTILELLLAIIILGIGIKLITHRKKPDVIPKI